MEPEHLFEYSGLLPAPCRNLIKKENEQGRHLPMPLPDGIRRGFTKRHIRPSEFDVEAKSMVEAYPKGKVSPCLPVNKRLPFRFCVKSPPCRCISLKSLCIYRTRTLQPSGKASTPVKM